MQQNVTRTFIENTQKHPDKIAIVDRAAGLFSKGYRQFTYGQMLDDVKHTAVRLQQLGFKKGDRIVVFTPMSYELYVILIAIFYMGAVAVFLDAWASRKRLAQSCLVVEPRGFIGCAKAQILMLVPEIRQIPIKALDSSVCKPGISSGITGLSPVDIHPDDEGFITLTTGSTGLPKGAKRTHGFLFEQFTILGKHFKDADQQINLTALPVFVFSNLGLSSTSVLPLFNPAKPTAFDPQIIIDQIQECRITAALGSPAFFEKIADYLIAHKQTLPLYSLLTGGAPVFKSLGRKLQQAFPETEIDIVYGSTEAEPISSIRLEDSLSADPSLGLPVGVKDPAIEVRVLQPTIGPVSIHPGKFLDDYLLPAGEVGELIVSGAHVLRGYIGSPEAFRDNKIVDGDIIWHRTGDAGLIDENGNIYLHGRVKNVILSYGKTVYALPYEQRLIELDGVVFAAVMEAEGIVFAAIEPDPGLPDFELGRLLKQARKVLFDIKIDRFMIMPKIPRDPRHNSKIDFPVLLNYLKGMAGR